VRAWQRTLSAGRENWQHRVVPRFTFARFLVMVAATALFACRSESTARNVDGAPGDEQAHDSLAEAAADAGFRADADASPPASQLVLVWSDEFDGPKLDSTKWQTPSMNRQGDHSKWDPSEVSLVDGKLRLGARRVDGSGPRYVCGAVRTRIDYDRSRTLYEKKYGYMEIRARLPKHLSSDYWFAFWIMAGDIRDGQTDSRLGSEIDIVETFTAWNGKLGHAVHWGGYGATHNSFDIPSPTFTDLADSEYHTYGLLWNEREYVIYRDGVRIGSTNAIGLGKPGLPSSQGTCREPGYLKLTVEAATWAGPTGDWEKIQPATDEALVDYIRVYDVLRP
jgi:beta-glucanase (GH16 family)